MITRQASADRGIGICITASTAIHLAVFLLLFWWGVLFPPNMNIQETYYVDVVNLPVASPRAGSPTQKGNDLEAPTPPAPENRMTVPSPPKPETKGKKSSDKMKNDVDSDAFAKKMAKLQGKAEDQQAESAIERLRHKKTAGGSGRSGMPAAGGTEAGSRYEDYIKSRLEDALKKTSNYKSRQSRVIVNLVIAGNGRITRQKLVSSNDPLFERAVLRAIEIAQKEFPPTPNKKPFETNITVTPERVLNKKT